MNNSNVNKTEKVKKTLSTEQLEKLKVAREKALSVRQTNAKNKALEKELASAEKEQHLNNVKEKLAKVKATGNAESVATLRSKQEAPVIVQVESEPDEPEPDAPLLIKKKKKFLKKKIIVVEDSDTDEEQQQVIYVKKVKSVASVVVTPPEPKATPLIDPYAQHYNSIFGRR